MNRTLATISTLVVLAAMLARLALTDKASLLIIAVSLTVTLFLCWVFSQSVSQSSSRDSLTGVDTPLAAIILGSKRGLGLFACCLLGFAIAWLGGLWTPASHRHDSRAGLAALAAPSNMLAPRTSVNVAKIAYHQPFLFLDVLVVDHKGRVVEALGARNFLVRVDGATRGVQTVTRTQYESPRHVAVLRDASGSVRGKPYPDLIVAATSAVRESLQSATRPSYLRVANFSDVVTDVSGWSSNLSTAVTTFNPAAAKAELSAIVVSSVNVIEDLGRREGGRRLVLITDGGNNVPSEYSTAGLIAHARRAAVTIDIVALPTEHLQQPQREFLQAIARETGGVYVDAASPSATRDLRHAMDADRDVRPAFRLTIECPTEVEPNLVTVDVVSVPTVFDMG